MKKLSTENIIKFFIFVTLVTGIVLLITELTKDKDNGTNPPGTNPPGTNGTNPPGTNGTNVTNPDPKISEEAQIFLDKHNEYRLNAEYPLLKWSKSLENQATEYAKQLNSTNTFVHGNYYNTNCKGNGYSDECGQNISRITGGSEIMTADAVDRWYNECVNYNNVPTTENDMKKYIKSGKQIGHYTQVMWKDAKLVGCGIRGSIGNCLYDTGNVLGQYESNVPKPGRGKCNKTTKMINGAGRFMKQK
jgi:uncharacterized protein YkwD